MKRADVEALAGQVGRMLAAVEAGEMDASPAMRHRLMGAVAVLRVVLGDDPERIVASIVGTEHFSGGGNHSVD